MMAHAVEVRPFLAHCRPEDAIHDDLTQARPVRLAGIERRQGVPILHIGRHDRNGEPEALGIDQRDTLASLHLLVGVPAARPAHGDGFDTLGIDNA